ncbi:MAG: hypothetical protein ACKVS6_05415 [Planctomycetota bacterium]
MRANNKKTEDATGPGGEQPAHLRAAIEQMRMLRSEHRPILEKIISDAGMAPGTRQVLIAHLQTEEDEKFARIAQLVSGANAPASASGAANITNSQFSVGSLRHEPPAAPLARGSVGSLRRETQ